MGISWDNGKDNLNHYLGLYWGYIGDYIELFLLHEEAGFPRKLAMRVALLKGGHIGNSIGEYFWGCETTT